MENIQASGLILQVKSPDIRVTHQRMNGEFLAPKVEPPRSMLFQLLFDGPDDPGWESVCLARDFKSAPMHRAWHVLNISLNVCMYVCMNAQTKKGIETNYVPLDTESTNSHFLFT